MSKALASSRAVNAICCDIGDVLFYDFPIKQTYSFYMHEIIRRHHADPPGLWELWHCTGQQVGALSRIDAELWADANTQAWNLVVDRWSALFQPIPDAHAALKSLRKTPIVLVANQPKHILPILYTMGFTATVDHIVLDTVCGYAKPAPEIYLNALERLERAPELCVMIGDDVDNDVIPAKRLGMKSVWIDPYPYTDQIHVPDIPASWIAVFRDGRAKRMEEKRRRVAALDAFVRPDLCAPSLAAYCGWFL